MENRFSKLTAWAVTFALVLALVPAFPLTARAADASAGSLADLTAAIGGAPTDGTPYTIEITAPFDVTATVFIPAGTNITLTGGALTRGAGTLVNLFHVFDNAALTLADITMDGGGTPAAPMPVPSALVSVAAGGTLDMKSGAILQNNNNTTNGGGVYMAGTFTMDGGIIRGNTAEDGGGVYMINGTFTMTGGEISGNTANSRGGGVYVGVNSEFTMSGTAQISGNTAGADSEGDGIFLLGGTITNDSTITDSVFIIAGTFTNGGTFTGGVTVSPSGMFSNNGAVTGGLIINNGTINNTGTIEDCTITNDIGTLDNAGGSITGGSIENNGTFNNAGGAIENSVITGTATITGGTIYYAVTFDSNGGSAAATLTGVVSGSTITAPAAPTKENHTFGGWYTDNVTFAVPWDFDTDTVTAKTTLYAQWTANTYAVTYHLDGGTLETGTWISYTYGVGLTLPAATKTGYTFDGWYGGENLTGASVTSIPATETGDKEFWAKWTANTYAITYHLDGGALETGTWISYTYGVGLTLPAATKTGYTFDGWYSGENLTGASVTSIPATETGDKEFWAKWTENHTHSYGTAWVSDNTHHWRECDCGEAADKAEHTENDGQVTTKPTATATGVKTFSCAICGTALRTEILPAKIKGEGVEVVVDVTVIPTVQVTVLIFYNGAVLYEETFSKD